MSAPLDGIIVVAIEQAVAAPTATRQLADLGARVLKIEHPAGGDLARHYDANTAGQSTYFVWGNRGKDSLVLDLKDPDHRARLDSLIAGADVFVQNLSPAAAGRAGLLAEQLVQRFAHLVACDISGYGLTGPRTDDKAYDLAIQAEAGAIALTGAEEQMSKVGLSIADIASGMYATTSILAALYRRDRTGEGAAISVSMLDCLAEWTSPQVLTAVATGHAPIRSPRRHPMIAPYGIFELGDGRPVLIAVQSDREFPALVGGVLGQPELATDDRFTTAAARIAHVDELETIIRDSLVSIDADEAVARLRRARVAHAFVREPGEVFEHEQFVARDHYLDVETPTGRATVLRPAFDISGLPEPPHVVPGLDEHDDALLAELERRARRRLG
jgi:itaconate CoA-transferase